MDMSKKVDEFPHIPLPGAKIDLNRIARLLNETKENTQRNIWIIESRIVTKAKVLEKNQLERSNNDITNQEFKEDVIGYINFENEIPIESPETEDKPDPWHLVDLNSKKSVNKSYA